MSDCGNEWIIVRVSFISWRILMFVFFLAKIVTFVLAAFQEERKRKRFCNDYKRKLLVKFEDERIEILYLIYGLYTYTYTCTSAYVIFQFRGFLKMLRNSMNTHTYTCIEINARHTCKMHMRAVLCFSTKFSRDLRRPAPAYSFPK